MINLEKLNNNFDEISKRLMFRNVKKEVLLVIKELFIERKKNIDKLNKLRFEKNSIQSKEKKINLKSIELKKEIKIAESNLEKNINDLKKLCYTLPNIPFLDTPSNEEGNKEIESIFYKKNTNNSLTYEEIIKKIDIIDVERSIKISGSKFVVYKNLGVKILHSLINFMMEENNKFGFNLISAPYLVKKESLYNTGQLPKFSDDIFKIEKYDLNLIPTSEVTLVNLYSNEIIESEKLPIKLCSYSSCFRAEVGSAGQENKGLIRLHQFNKVEIVGIAEPENSHKLFKEMIKCVRNILDKLQISYKIIRLCYEELGISAAITYDFMILLPNSNKYIEISSITNCEDFQSNRANIRTKKNGKKIMLHTLNGSSLAIDRLILAILEYYYDEKNNKIIIPISLEKYL